MVEKFLENLNMNELIGIIEKETNVSKSEKGMIKTCALSGKIIMLKEILEIPTINSEIIFSIFKILFEMLPHAGVLGEAILQVTHRFLHKLKQNLYSELQEKKVGRFMDKFLTLISKIVSNKVQFENIKNICEFDLIFILNCFTGTDSILGQSINNFLSTTSNLLSETSLANYFKLLLSLNFKDNELHVSFKHFLEFLKNKNDFSKVVDVWNTLIDQNVQSQLKQVSLKNYQYLIFNFSKFVLEHFFILKYIKEIFDSTYFDNLMKFSTPKKFKIINSLIEVLVNKLKKLSVEDEGDVKGKSEYCNNLLQIFGNDQNVTLSPQSYKNFYTFLFNNLEEHTKLEYIESLAQHDIESEEEDENLMFKITALRQLMVSGEVTL